MSMSKQDFIALADALRTEKPADHWDPNKKAQWENDCKAIAQVCKRANSAFKADRWFAYIAGECGPNGGTIKKESTVLHAHGSITHGVNCGCCPK